jgi:YidC/Oxa1 family membrane protein insertase
MDRNAILATVLVVLILVGYQWYLSRFEAPAPEQQPAATSTTPTQPAPAAATIPPQIARPTERPSLQPKNYTPTAQRQATPREISVKTPLANITFSTLGARATHWKLNAYQTANGQPVDLVAATATPGGGPGALAAWVSEEQGSGVFDADKEGIDLTQGKQSDTLTFTYVTLAGLETQKSITFYADRYQADVAIRVRNLSGADTDAQVRLAWGPGLRNSFDKKATTLQQPTLWLDGKRHQEDVSNVKGEKVLGGSLSWTALQDTYFTAAILPADTKSWQAFVAKAAEDQPIVGLVTSKQSLPAAGQLELKAQVYAGPRDLDILKGVGQSLDQMIDLGWFDFLARPALWLLKLLYQVTGNYGVAIILITILQKVAFHPLTHKSLKSMQAMQALQPKVQALQERYKNNPQKKQEEMMALYRKHGVNPMGGCLPMVIQIPIFIALYNALSSSVEMWQAHFLWIRDLTQPDALFGITIWEGYPLNFLALLMGASMWLQQKMTPTAGDPRQAQMMLWTMPIVFTFMFWSFPSGLVLYWLVNNVLQIGQQWLINRHSGRPAAPEPQAA